ncbi:tetratricopeptide repeat protein [Streptosporangium sp. G11]
MFWGIGGIGKTSLLRELQIRVKAAGSAVSMATLETAHAPIDLMRVWREQLPGRPFRTFDKELRRYAQVMAKLHRATGGPARDGGVTGGLMEAARGSGIIGGFIAGAIGEERIRAFLSQYLSGREASIFIQGADVLTRAFSAGVNEVARSTRTHLFLDYYEAATAEIDDWMRRLITGGLSVEVVLTVAGRESLRRTSPRWVEFSTILRERELTALSEPEVREYLNRVSVQDPEVRREIEHLAGGIPWALALSVDAMREAPSATVEYHEDGRTVGVRTMVASRFLSQLAGQSAQLRETVEAAALTAWFDRDLLRELVGRDCTEDIDHLLRFSFLSMRRDGTYMIKDAVREAVAVLVRQQNPLRWKRVNDTAAQYHQRQLAESRPLTPGWGRHFLELIRTTLETDPLRAVEIFTESVAALPIQIWNGTCGPALLLLEDHEIACTHTSVRYYRGLSLLATNDLSGAREMLELVAESSDAQSWMKMRAYAGIVDIDHRAGDVRTSFDVAVTAHDTALGLDLCADAAIFAARAGEMSGSIGDEQQSLRYLRLAEQHLTRCTDDFAHGQAELILCYTHTFAARYSEGTDHLDRALERWHAAGYKFGTAQIHSARAWLGWLTGRISDGIASAKVAIAYFDQIGDVYSKGLAALNMAELERRRGNLDAAIEWNQTADSLLTETGGLLYHAIVLYRIGRAYLDAGDTDRAIEHLSNSIRIQREKIGEKYSEGMAMLYLAEAFAMVGDPRATETLKNAQSTLGAAQNKYGRVAALVVGAVIRRRIRPDSDEALRELAEGVANAEELGFADLVAEGMAEQALAESAEDRAVDAVTTALRHSPHCAATVLTRVEPVLRAVPPQRSEELLGRLDTATPETERSAAAIVRLRGMLRSTSL